MRGKGKRKKNTMAPRPTPIRPTDRPPTHAHALTLSPTQEMKAPATTADAAASADATSFDVDALVDDPDLTALHRDRLAALAAEAEARARIASSPGGGALTTVTEGDVLEACTSTARVVVHFFHPSFSTCALLDRHLTTLAAKHTSVRFLRTPAPDAPFLAVKLRLKVLPALLSFVDGACVGRCSGCDAFGGFATFTAADVERELRRQGGVPPPVPRPRAARRAGVRRGGLCRDSSDSESAGSERE